MDNDNFLSDMKQLLRAELSQTEARISVEFKKVHKEISDMHTEMIEGFAGIGDPLTAVNDQLEDHEARIDALEHKAA